MSTPLKVIYAVLVVGFFGFVAISIKKLFEQKESASEELKRKKLEKKLKKR